MITDVGETALMGAAYRARETMRRNPLVQDFLAARLAGARGASLIGTLPFKPQQTWLWAVRTFLIDQIVMRQLRAGIHTVINLAAGLDTRPYRLPLPHPLLWVEVDLPHVIAYKERVLRRETPLCSLVRLPLDLADIRVRRLFFKKLRHRAENALVISEGLLVYFSPREARLLARNLASAGFRRWVIDLMPPSTLTAQQADVGEALRQAGSPLRFAPQQGAEFFRAQGWEPVSTLSLLRTAVQIGRVPPKFYRAGYQPLDDFSPTVSLLMR